MSMPLNFGEVSRKRSLVGVCLSGGGAKIGFAVGVLEAMAEHGIAIDLAYGISSGSICTAGLCFGDLPFLKRTLLSIRTRKDVLKRQWAKVIWTSMTGRGHADGCFEMGTMRKKLDTLPYDDPQIKGVVGYVSLQTGEIIYKAVSGKGASVSKEEFLDAVQASCSIPVYMQSQRVGQNNYVDGGIKDVLPLKPIIQDPLGVGEIHVICLSPIMTPPAEKAFTTIFQVAGRSVDLLVNEVLQNDYDYAVLVNKLIEQKDRLSLDLQAWLQPKRRVEFYRYVPTRVICDTTDFRSETIQKGIDHGREVAAQVLRGYEPTPGWGTSRPLLTRPSPVIGKEPERPV